MDYIIGVSGADNVTSVNIATIAGVVVQSFTVGAISFLFASEDEVTHNMAEVFVTAQMAGYPVRNCRQICIGAAGLMGGREMVLKLDPTLRGVIRRCGYTGDALLLGDEQIALAGALGAKKGAILLAGKMSACYGQSASGLSHRTGGLGELCDDDGSAYAIGREILRAVARAGDGRGQLTHLTAHVYRQFKLACNADFARLLRTGAPTAGDICELSLYLSKACQLRDKVALAIVEKTVDELTALVTPVVRRLSLQKSVLAVAGSVLLNDAYVGASFKKKLTELFPELQCVPPHSDGAAGAVLLAKERLALRGYGS